jgi:hypothetical protein
MGAALSELVSILLPIVLGALTIGGTIAKASRGTRLRARLKGSLDILSEELPDPLRSRLREFAVAHARELAMYEERLRILPWWCRGSFMFAGWLIAYTFFGAAYLLMNTDTPDRIVSALIAVGCAVILVPVVGVSLGHAPSASG